MKNTHFKTYIIVAIFISIIGISIAYAALQQQLQIKTSTTIQSSQTSWNIVLEKHGCYGTGNSIEGKTEITGTTVTMSGFILKTPGDWFACELYVENKGEVNAKILSVNYIWPTISGTGSTATEDAKLINDNIYRGFKWHNPDVNFQVGDILPAGAKKEIIIQYGINSSMTTLPTNPVTFSNAVATINFEQA